MALRPHPPDEPPQNENGERATWAKNLGLFAAVVGDLIGYTGAGVGLGYLAWKKWNAPWWVILVSSSAGLILAMVRLYQISKLADREENADTESLGEQGKKKE